MRPFVTGDSVALQPSRTLQAVPLPEMDFLGVIDGGVMADAIYTSARGGSGDD